MGPPGNTWDQVTGPPTGICKSCKKLKPWATPQNRLNILTYQDEINLFDQHKRDRKVKGAGYTDDMFDWSKYQAPRIRPAVRPFLFGAAVGVLGIETIVNIAHARGIAYFSPTLQHQSEEQQKKKGEVKSAPGLHTGKPREE